MSGARHFRIGQDDTDDPDDIVEIDLTHSSRAAAGNGIDTKDSIIEMEMNVNPFHGAGAGNSVHNGVSSFDALRAQIPEMPAWVPACLQPCARKSPILFGILLSTVLVSLPLFVCIAYGAANANASSAVNQAATGSSTESWARFSATSNGGGMVATDNAVCSEIAADMLKGGGNAADAAVAAALCLGVLSPASSGIGGGCFIVSHNSSTGGSAFLDSRETAPAAATETMFDVDPQLSQDGGLAIATLGELKGLYQLHQSSGSLAWGMLVAPAALLAREWTLSAHAGDVLQQMAPVLLHDARFAELASSYVVEQGGVRRVKVAGEMVRQPKLAATLDSIAASGSDYLYVDMAETLAAEIRAAGGITTAADIRGYSPRSSPPVNVTVMGHTFLSASGSSSGGAAVAGILLFMEGFSSPLVSQGLEYAHYLTEAMKNAFAVRMSLGDPVFVNITGPVSALESSVYMSALRGEVLQDTVLPLMDYGGAYSLARARRYLVEDHGTTHLSVLDKWGNAVALTSTVNTDFGSKVVSPSTGIVFNNQMDDFSNSVRPNAYGLHPSRFNYPEGGKRPLSSMSPSIVLDRYGAVRLVGGASGGPRIITATVQVILNYLGRGMDLLSALRNPRTHSQLLPDLVYDEQHLLVSGLRIDNPTSLFMSLAIKGHNVTNWSHSMGVAQFVARDPDTGVLTGVSDPRKDGKPCGA